jgi:hypothetical protein
LTLVDVLNIDASILGNCTHHNCKTNKADITTKHANSSGSIDTGYGDETYVGADMVDEN